MKRLTVLGFVIMFTVALTGYSVAAEYVGSYACFKCHPNEYNDFVVSGHPTSCQRLKTQ